MTPLVNVSRFKGKGQLMSFLVLILLASIGGYVPSALVRNEAISRDAYRAFLESAGPVFTSIRVIGWASLFVFVAGLRVAPPEALRPASKETGDWGPMASTMEFAQNPGTADSKSQPHSETTEQTVVPDRVRNTMQVLIVVAILYAIGLLCATIWLASLGARFLPLLAFAAIATLYGVSIRFAMVRKYGKSTGFMIAAGILNLPVGILAVIVGVVARRVWRKWDEEKQYISPGETDRNPIDRPVAASD